MTARTGRSWAKWLLFLVIVAGAIAGWRWYAGRPQDAKVDYKTSVVSRGDITQAVTANGQINPVKIVTVGSQVSGMLTDIKVDFNSLVKTGQVIAQIDPSTYQRSVTQAEAELANSRAALELTQLSFRRARDLQTNNLIPLADYDKALVEMHQAEAGVKMREAALEKAKVDLERTTIYAPIDGMVISRSVEVGQTVAASFNTPTLFQIANDLRRMRIEAMVSEADVGGVEEGQSVTFTVDAYLGRTFQGRVTQVRFAPITNQNVVNYSAVIDVSNDDLKLRPGMTANVSVISAQRRDVLRVPNAALRFRPPENAIVSGGTNAPAGEGATTNLTARPGAGPGDGMGRSSPEERRRRLEAMSPEERERMRAMWRARSGDGPGGGPGGGAGMGRSRAEGPGPRTVYLIETNALSGKSPVALKPVPIKIGITDGAFTEVLEGLKENDVVASGVNLPASAVATRPGATPFGGPFGGFRGPR